MHDTLLPLVERALTGNHRPLEFYLREHSRLPGSRVNLDLADELSYLLASAIPRQAESVHALLNKFVNADRKTAAGSAPADFVMCCGILAFGSCAAGHASWRDEAFLLLSHYSESSSWRIRDSVTLAYHYLLRATAYDTLTHLQALATDGSYLQQRSAVTVLAESQLLYNAELLESAFDLHRIVLERVHSVPERERRQEEFKLLKRALGYTLSVITAAAPEQGFALMGECADWNDVDIEWILRENLKKKRLAKYRHSFIQDTEALFRLLA